MYRIGLVQNQSEMAHYGYADARPLLDRLGYGVDLFTAANVTELPLQLRHFDAIVLSSNALNDKTVRGEFESEQLRVPLLERIEAGLGILCLHQLKLAQRAEVEEGTSALAFLGPTLGAVSARVRPAEERSAEGSLTITDEAKSNITVLYPHAIDPQRLKDQALGFRSLPGLYWHYWAGTRLSEWDALVIDDSYDDSPRVLVACTKESAQHRVVISSLTLDWQQQTPFLGNLLTFVVEGRHNTALLSQERRSSTAYEFLKSTLSSRKFPHREYFAGQDLSALRRNLDTGVHRVLLLGPFVDEQRLEQELRASVGSLVRNGDLNLLSIEPPEAGVGSVSLSGRERFATRVLQETELKVQGELLTGNIDGSFWSTAETLQTLEALEESRANYRTLVDRALVEADKHDRSGSYDEVFGVTCAFYWMRATYRGAESEEANATRAWIESNIHAYATREQSLAYTTFAYTGTLTLDERKTLKEILASLSLANLTETDLITYLQAALAVEDLDRIPDLVEELGKKQKNGVWVDLATSATAATALIDALDALRLADSAYGELQPRIEGLIFETVNLIQEEYQRSTARELDGDYPWDGKASTTVKCLQAWLRFDRLLDLPIYEVVEVLARRDQDATAVASGKIALRVLEALKRENDELRERLELVEPVAAELEPLRVRRRRALFLSALIAYTLITLVVGVVQSSGGDTLGASLARGFASNWGYHLSFAALVVSGAAFYKVLRRYFGFKGAQTDGLSQG